MTIQVTVLNGPGSATVGSGGSFVLAAGMLVQFQDVLPDGTLGPIWNPTEILSVPSGNDLVLTFPNGETLVLTDALLVLAGTALEDQLPAASPEAALEPAAGPGGGGGANGSGSIQAASPFVDDGFGNLFGFNPGGGFTGLDTPGLTIPAFDPNIAGLGAGPVPQLATFALPPGAMTMGLEDKPIPLLTVVTQNDIEGLGEILDLTIRDIPPGAVILDADGNVLFTAAPGSTAFSVAPALLPSLQIIPAVADDDSDFTLTLVAVTSEPTNPPSGVATNTILLPVVVKAVADPAKFTLDNLMAAQHPMGVSKNPIQQEMEGRGGTGANDPDPTATDFGAHDLGTLVLPTTENLQPVVSVDGWINVNDGNDVDLYKIDLAGIGPGVILTYKFDIEFGDGNSALGKNGPHR